jgi:hypothetical protein
MAVITRRRNKLPAGSSPRLVPVADILDDLSRDRLQPDEEVR